MRILSKGQLMETIDKNGVETILVSSSPGKMIVDTVIYKKSTNVFYMIRWGEIDDKSGQSHIWFEEETKRVEMNPDGVWMTKEDMRKYLEGTKASSSIDTSPLTNVEYEAEGVNKTLMARAGKGRSLEMIRRAAIELKENKSVLFISIEDSEGQVLNSVVKALARESYVNLELDKATHEDLQRIEDAIKLVNSGKLVVKSDRLIDNNYIKEAMCEMADSEHGLDLVIVDNLKLDTSYSTLNNTESIEGVFKYIDKLARELSCRVEVSTELNIH